MAVAWFSLALIVATGAAVRLTESGLGCEDWPRCSEERLVPELAFHPWIEFGNRLLSGVVALAVAAAVLTAYRRVPRRSDLIGWAWGLVAGVAAQIVLGGITVRVDLHPLFVGAHFLLSIVLLWNATVLYVKATSGPGPARPAVAASVVVHGRALVALAVGVLVTGTLVTGTGPNSGDSRAERLQFDLADVTRVHTAFVWTFLAVAVVLAVRLAASGRAQVHVRALLATILAQGAIGYVQYALGVPPLLVELHVIGSMVVWTFALLTYLRLFERPHEEFTDERVKSGRSVAKMNA